MDSFEKWKKSDLQTYTSEWLSSIEPNAFVTFSFRYATSYAEAEKIFGSFIHRVKCEFWGRNSKKRIPMTPVIEKYKGNKLSPALTEKVEGIHIHCIMHLPGNPMDHKSKFKDLWIKTNRCCGDPDIYCPKGSGWFKEICTSEDQKMVTDYVLKTCITDTEPMLLRYTSLKSLN